MDKRMTRRSILAISRLRAEHCWALCLFPVLDWPPIGRRQSAALWPQQSCPQRSHCWRSGSESCDEVAEGAAPRNPLLSRCSFPEEKPFLRKRALDLLTHSQECGMGTAAEAGKISHNIGAWRQHNNEFTAAWESAKQAAGIFSPSTADGDCWEDSHGRPREKW